MCDKNQSYHAHGADTIGRIVDIEWHQNAQFVVKTSKLHDEDLECEKYE